MIYSPETPTTTDLHEAFYIDRKTGLAIAGNRTDINRTIVNPDNRFLLAGPCALTNDPETLLAENAEWLAFAEAYGLVAAARRHPFKPRSVTSLAEKKKKWHGFETGFPDGVGEPEQAALTAYEIMYQEAVTHNNVSMEIAFPKHVDRYGPLLSFAQIGARTREQYYGNYVAYLRFIDYLAVREPSLPIGIKNDTNGSIDLALEEVNRVNDIRTRLGISAVSRAVLIYRGGENAKTPETWLAGALGAIVSTHGAVILDAAHGGEQAFDPNGNYEKSEDGQLACIGTSMWLRKLGLRCVGLAAETSSLNSPMDPAASPDKVKAALEDAPVLVDA